MRLYRIVLAAIVLTLAHTFLLAQSVYTPAAVFAHNDYVGPSPFFMAYQHRVGYIEADIFLDNDELLVAHSKSEINSVRTLEALYLMPLANQVRQNGGRAYPEEEKILTLMIDLKTDGAATLPVLVKKLEQHKDLLSCKTLIIAVSGSMPAPAAWSNYPPYIMFDGRPAISYTSDQLKRVRIISDSFANYSKWDGSGAIPEADERRLRKVIAEVHQKGKQLRLWAIPDSPNAWIKLMDLGVDVLNTDHVAELIGFLDEGKH
jgi:alkaline phosphatase